MAAGPAVGFWGRTARVRCAWTRTPGGRLYLKHSALAGAELRREGEWTVITRAGPLPGAADYAGRPNHDQLVKSPLGLLWFGDTAHHHKLFYPGFTHEAGRGLPSTPQPPLICGIEIVAEANDGRTWPGASTSGM